MTKSLLEQAKEIPVYREHQSLQFNDQHVELVIAWLKHEIETSQFRKMIQKPSGSELSFSVNVMKWALANGWKLTK